MTYYQTLNKKFDINGKLTNIHTYARTHTHTYAHTRAHRTNTRTHMHIHTRTRTSTRTHTSTHILINVKRTKTLRFTYRNKNQSPTQMYLFKITRNMRIHMLWICNVARIGEDDFSTHCCYVTDWCTFYNARLIRVTICYRHQLLYPMFMQP